MYTCAISFGMVAYHMLIRFLAALLDGMFVVMQCYNRPRIMAILERRERRRTAQ